MLSLRWQESGGPPVEPPSRLLKRNLADELGGEVDVEYAQGGVICTIDFPLIGDDDAPLNK